MAVTIITGSIGSGKTQYCINRMKEVHSLSPDRRCIMLVPSHYSHITEKLLIDEFGGTGLNNIHCVSLDKLSRDLVSNSKPKLGVSGKHTLISRAIKLYLEELGEKQSDFDPRLLRSVTRRGFVSVCASLMGELDHYSVTPDKLTTEADKCEDKNLAQKLVILSGITDKYRELVRNINYADSDDDMHRLAEVIPQHFSENDIIWVDKFDGFLPQQFEVITALINSGADITFSFDTCPDNDDTYYGTRSAIRDISQCTDVRTMHLDGEMEHITVPDLKFLFSNWHNTNVYPDKVSNAEIFTARDSYTEIEHTASKILDLVREGGYRYSDIGIISPDPKSYSHIMEAIFDEYGIPYYSDESVAISEHPIAMQILSLFDIIDNNWDYASMFSYLRAGFVYNKTPKGRYKRIDPNDIDLLDNHVLKYGIDRRSAWCRSWANANNNIIDTAFNTEDTHKSTDFGYIDSIREKITAPIIAYNERVKSAKTVIEYCRALYEFLEDINLYQGLRGEMLAMATHEATADVQRFGQIWNLVLDVINQVATALGDTEVSHDEFGEYIRIAMSQCEIRTIPSGVDRVFVGSTDMNRALPTKVIFAIGATAGTYPTATTSEGYFSNAEREYLGENKLHLAPTTVKKTEKLRYVVYKLLSAVTEKLYISYPTMTPDGKTCLPSQTVTDIKNKLPRIIQLDDVVTDSNAMLYISSPKATLHKRLINPTDHPLWAHVDSWFDDHNQWRNKIFRINRARGNFSFRKIELREDLAKSLYEGNTRYSATRLNSYANCPFSHFMMYGIRAHENEEYEINAADTGTYAHEIIRRMCERIDTDPSLDWKEISKDRCEDIVDEIVKDTVSNIIGSDLRDKEQTADILMRMGKTVAAAAQTAVRSIACGEFRTDAYEKEVYIPIGKDIEVGGIIDRLDVCHHDGINEYRIIDYKTGNKAFKVSDIYHGIDMQPVIYALAMRMLDPKAKISGMYYSLMHNDYPTIDVTSKDSTAYSRLTKNTAFEGVTFAGVDKDGYFNNADLDRVESPLEREDGSLFFKTKGGDIVADKSLKTYADGENLMGFVRDKIIETDKEIKNGNIAISPIGSGTRSACTYCPYVQVCKFDEGLICQRTIAEKDEEVWEILEEDK